MRADYLSSVVLLALTLASGPASTEERWVYLGDVDDPATGARGKPASTLTR